MKKTLNLLKFYYYATLIKAVLVAAVGYYVVAKLGWYIDAMEALGRNISYAVMLYVIVSIPLALWWFNNKLKQIKQLASEEEKLKEYTKNSTIRIFIIGIGLLCGILFFYLLQNQSLMFCAGMSAIALYFCKPTEARILTDIENDIDNKVE